MVNSEHIDSNELKTHDLWQKMENLFSVFYQKLYVYAMGMLDDEEESMDVVSSVMQTIWEDWNNDTPKMSNPSSAMMYTMVRNRCLDILRRTKVKEKYAFTIEATSDFSDDEEVREFEDRISEVYEAVKRLPAKTRKVLECTYYEKMTYRETAEFLGISENMVRKHMIKAFKLMREMLKMLILWYTLSVIFV